MSRARLHVLGSSGGWPTSDNPCSGFALLDDSGCVVIDLGYGTVGPLIRLLGGDPALTSLTAILISHAHPDHMADLHAVLRARHLGADGTSAPLTVVAPRGVRGAVVALEPDEVDTIDATLAWCDPSDSPDLIAGWTLETEQLHHWLPDTAFRLERDGVSVVFSGDCGWDDGLIALARRADTLVIDATDRFQASGETEEMDLSAREAGRLGRIAGVGQVILTHFWPGNDLERSRADASAEFGGEVLLATPGAEFEI